MLVNEYGGMGSFGGLSSALRRTLPDILEKRGRELTTSRSWIRKAAFPTSRVVYLPVEKETRSENPHAS